MQKHKLKNYIMASIVICLLIIPATLKAESSYYVALKDHVTMNADTLKIKDLVIDEETDIEFIRTYGEIEVMSNKDSIDNISRSMLYRVLKLHGANMETIKFKMLDAINIEKGQELSLNSDAKEKIYNIIIHNP